MSTVRNHNDQPARVAPALWRASLVGFVIVVLALVPFSLQWRPANAMEVAFVVFALLSQALLIALPMLALAALTAYVERARPRGRAFRRVMLAGFAVVATAIAAVLLADMSIHAMYGFHINGFVLNLVSRRRAASRRWKRRAATWITVAASSFPSSLPFLAAWCGCSAAILLRRAARGSLAHALDRRTRAAMLLFDKGLYGYADLTGNGRILRASGLFPFYQPVTFRSAARRHRRRTRTAVDSRPCRSAAARLSETAARRGGARGQPPNILWLAVESMRWDLLTPTTMPRLWAVRVANLRFANHFSGGNRTRMGMFSMFYSLHGPYWSHVLDERRSPVLLDVLEQLGYDIEVYTSAKFSYPEFDRTIFVAVPADRRHEYSDDPIFWQRDVYNVDAIIKSLEQRDTRAPFMRFLFLESTHAPYQFPDADAIAKPYGSVANYALMNPEQDIALMWNRYVNAAHFIDSQIGRLIDHLDASGELDNTIVVVTGDHGEEFLEHGRWGHGSAFIDEQMRVPLVMRIPGRAHA